MSKHQLYILHGSPWSWQVKWVARFSDQAVTLVQYRPPFSELAVRWKTGNWSDQVSCPVLITPSGALSDSFDIAKWLNLANAQNDLFPTAYEEEIRSWNVTTGKMLGFGRDQYLARMLSDKQLRTAPIFGWLRVLGPLGDWLSVCIMQVFKAKWHASAAGQDAQQFQAHLEAMRGALQRGHGYIVGTSFTYADILAITALNNVTILGPPYGELLPMLTTAGAQTAFVLPGLAEKFPDLLQWRAEMLSKHFPLDKRMS